MRLRIRWPSKSLLYGFATLLAVAVLIWLEETRLGHVANFYGNFYVRTVYRPIEVRREKPTAPNISVFVFIDRAEQLTNYGLAQRSLACYCQLHGYPLRIVDLSKEAALQRECPHGDLMFRRHCAFARLLAAPEAPEFALFLDADMGVLNPNHLLEEYLTPLQQQQGESGGEGGFDLVFYERSFNGEIMAGSYLLRNTNFTRRFLHFWADYQFRLPQSFHGTDNGAIHAVFLDLFCGVECADQRRSCSALWNASTDWETLASFTVCARSVLGARNVFHTVPSAEVVGGGGKVLLLTDFKRFWARDGWLTGNQWGPRDFIFHGWQKQYLDRPGFAGWHSPLALEDADNNSSCLAHASAALNWPYKNTFMRTDQQIVGQMEAIVRKRKLEMLAVLRENIFYNT